MFVYFVRWSAYYGEKLYGVGQLEITLEEPISSMKHIEAIQEIIRKDDTLFLEEDDFIAIDFYTLLRQE